MEKETKKISYEDIQKANETIKTTDIKGKQYSEVNQRIKAFRMVYPTGIIETEMLSNENGVCVFKAMIGYRDGEEIYKLATGTAYEKENSTFINKTSYIENCETSAIGRALGMCGFGIDTSVASVEEVSNAIANQEAKDNKQGFYDYMDKQGAMIDEGQKQKIKSSLSDESIAKLLKQLKVESIEKLTWNQARQIEEKIREKEEEKRKDEEEAF